MSEHTTIPITPAVIDRYKELLFTPEKHGHPEAPKWKEVIEKSTICTAKSVLFESVKAIWPMLPKLVFYIIANEHFKQGYDDNQNLGYYAKVTEVKK